MATPDLLGIPNEMVVLIAEHLTNDSLLHLRASCKAMGAVTGERYRRYPSNAARLCRGRRVCLGLGEER